MSWTQLWIICHLKGCSLRMGCDVDVSVNWIRWYIFMREVKQNQVKFNFHGLHVMEVNNKNWPQAKGTATGERQSQLPHRKWKNNTLIYPVSKQELHPFERQPSKSIFGGNRDRYVQFQRLKTQTERKEKAFFTVILFLVFLSASQCD